MSVKSICYVTHSLLCAVHSAVFRQETQTLEKSCRTNWQSHLGPAHTHIKQHAACTLYHTHTIYYIVSSVPFEFSLYCCRWKTIYKTKYSILLKVTSLVRLSGSASPLSSTPHRWFVQSQYAFCRLILSLPVVPLALPHPSSTFLQSVLPGSPQRWAMPLAQSWVCQNSPLTPNLRLIKYLCSVTTTRQALILFSGLVCHYLPWFCLILWHVWVLWCFLLIKTLFCSWTLCSHPEQWPYRSIPCDKMHKLKL